MTYFCCFCEMEWLEWNMAKHLPIVLWNDPEGIGGKLVESTQTLAICQS